MQNIDTIENTIASAIGTGTARDYARHVDLAANALLTREARIKANLTEAARSAGVSDAAAAIEQAFGDSTHARELAQAEEELRQAQEAQRRAQDRVASLRR